MRWMYCCAVSCMGILRKRIKNAKLDCGTVKTKRKIFSERGLAYRLAGRQAVPRLISASRLDGVRGRHGTDLRNHYRDCSARANQSWSYLLDHCNPRSLRE